MNNNEKNLLVLTLSLIWGLVLVLVVSFYHIHLTEKHRNEKYYEMENIQRTHITVSPRDKPSTARIFYTGRKLKQQGDTLHIMVILKD